MDSDVVDVIVQTAVGWVNRIDHPFCWPFLSWRWWMFIWYSRLLGCHWYSVWQYSSMRMLMNWTSVSRWYCVMIWSHQRVLRMTRRKVFRCLCAGTRPKLPLLSSLSSLMCIMSENKGVHVIYCIAEGCVTLVHTDDLGLRDSLSRRFGIHVMLLFCFAATNERTRSEMYDERR